MREANATNQPAITIQLRGSQLKPSSHRIPKNECKKIKRPQKTDISYHQAPPSTTKLRTRFGLSIMAAKKLKSKVVSGIFFSSKSSVRQDVDVGDVGGKGKPLTWVLGWSFAETS